MHVPGRGRMAAAISATLLLTASVTGAAATDLSRCVDKGKMDAFLVREVQTHLMVAALVCDAAPEYNAFVKRFTPTLVQHGHQLRRHFSVTYGPDGGSHLNQFVTNLANRVSQLSATSPAEFCTRTLALFNQAKSETLPSLLPAEARTLSVDGADCRVALR